MSRFSSPLLVLSLAAGLVHSPLLAQAAAPPSPPASERSAADTPKTTPGGATFTLPSEWEMTAKGPLLVLEPPEADSHVVFLDVDGKDAKDSDAAVAAAGVAYRPDSKRPLRIATPDAPRNGWDERRTYEYETSPNERATVSWHPQCVGRGGVFVCQEEAEAGGRARRCVSRQL